MKSVARYLGERAGREPNRPLFSFLDVTGAVTETWRYGPFNRRANFLAAELTGSGAIAAGEPVLLVYPPGIEIAAAFFACAKAGAIPVPVPPPGTAGVQAGMDRLALIAADTGARTALTDRRLAKRMAESGAADGNGSGAGSQLSSLTWIATDDLLGEADDFDVEPAACLFIQYTSGSTRDPRGVMVTDANVIHNCGLSVDHPHPVGVSWLPHYHDMGLIGYFLFPVITGGSACCIAPIDFMRRPALWLETMSTVGATITTVPNFAFDYCLRTDKVPDSVLEGLDLSAVRQMVNASEPVRASTMVRFMRRFARTGLRESALVTGYGLAEHTLCVTAGGRATAADGGDPVPVSCGPPPPDVDLRIVDTTTGAPAAEGESGEILVSSPSKAAGYWRKPRLSAEVFEASVAGLPGRYLRTGDIGFIAKGELHVCGRAKDMIIVRGQNIYPSDIEALIESAAHGIAPGSVVAFGTGDTSDREEGVVVLVETSGAAAPPDIEALRQMVLRHMTIPLTAIATVAKGSIVRTSSAKIARGRCRERWEQGEIRVIACIREGDEGAADSARFIDALVERLQADCDGGDTLEAAGLDSLELVTLSLHVDEMLTASVPNRNGSFAALFDLRLLQSLTVDDLAGLVRELREQAPDPARLGAIAATTARAVEAVDRAEMRRDMKTLAVRRASPPSPRAEGHRALLTGATGFLGSWLLRTLVKHTDMPLTVLVRGDDQGAAKARLVQALVSTGLPADTAAGCVADRIEVVSGDLAVSGFGLEPDAWRKLCANVTSIYHCAADVDYVRTYRTLRPANVLGTAEVIRLASEGPAKTLHFVSTTFIFGWTLFDRLKESGTNRRMSGLDFGYAQSKWVAEQLIGDAAARGLDARIYRPSLVTASRCGRFVRRDITARVLGYMIRHGITVEAENQISFLPVDVCAANIVAISLLDNVARTCFHLTDDGYYHIGTVCDAIARDFGYRFRQTDISGFIAHINRYCTSDDDLFPLIAFFNRNADRIERMKHKRYDNRSYRHARALSSLALPHPPLAETVGSIVSFLQRERLV